MRILRSSAVMLALVGLALMVGCQSSEQREADKKAAQEDLDKMKGKWKISSSQGTFSDPETKEDDDGKEKTEELKGRYFEIEDDILLEKEGNTVLRRKKLTLRPKSDPKQMDLLQVDEKNKPMTVTVWKRAKKGKSTKSQKEIKEVAVYKLEGDKLTIASSWDDKKRPSGFTLAPDGYVLTLTKVGAGEKPDKDNEKEDKKAKDKEDKKAKDKEDKNDD